MEKKVLKTIALTLVLLLTATTAAFAAVPADVKGQSYEEAVSALMEKGIVTGDTDGSFHPDSELTRAQACIIIVKAMNPPAAEVTGTATQLVKASGFSDLAGYGWAEGYIAYAVKQGVTKGYPDGTFKPGALVSMNELITMIVRAAGYSDEKLGGTWPSNYTDKAAGLNLLDGIPAPVPATATKWMAADTAYRALSLIEKANPPAETSGQGTDQDKASDVPDASAMTFVNGSFNDTMTTYNGKTISKNVKLYTYGVQKDYSGSMTFSKKTSDYREETVYKFKNAKTPAFYQLENDKIVSMIVPRDAGYTGNAYSVINGTVSTANYNNDAVTGLETLTATREITWLAKKGLTAPEKSEYLDGEVYELNITNGEVKGINKANEKHKGKLFDEISGTGFAAVKEVKDGVAELESGTLIAVKDNASVYILDGDDAKEYKSGRVSSIKAGDEIRAYDMTKDDDGSADVVVVRKK